MTAVLSADRTYRYTLERDVAPLTGNGIVVFIGLNPSTADETVDDPTIRRCIDFARRWGYAKLRMVNLYAYRATDPLELWDARRRGEDIIGPDNDTWIHASVAAARIVVAAWGGTEIPGRFERTSHVMGDLLEEAYCLGTTKYGCPRHPLYVRADHPLERYPT